MFLKIFGCYKKTCDKKNADHKCQKKSNTAYKLHEASRFCEFENLCMKEVTIEDKFILLSLIESIFDVLCKHKILEQL